MLSLAMSGWCDYVFNWIALKSIWQHMIHSYWVLFIAQVHRSCRNLPFYKYDNAIMTACNEIDCTQKPLRCPKLLGSYHRTCSYRRYVKSDIDKMLSKIACHLNSKVWWYTLYNSPYMIHTHSSYLKYIHRNNLKSWPWRIWRQGHWNEVIKSILHHLRD